MALFEDKVKKLKDDIKADDKLFRNKPRYGLFSYTPNFGPEIGLQSPPEGRRDAKGNVRIDPKNFLTRRTSFFAKTGFLCETSKYMDTGKMTTFRSASPSRMHKKAFKTVSCSDTLFKNGYEHMADQGRDIKVEGFGKKGMYTSNAKKGLGNTTTGHLFSKQFEHISDPYENKRNLEIKANEGDKKKIVGKRNFVNSSYAKDYFTSHRDTFYNPNKNNSSFESDRGLGKSLKSSKKAFVPSSPAKIGFNRTLNKFPEHMANPLPPLTPHKNKKELIWRYNYNELSAPITSVKKYNEKFRPRGNFDKAPIV